MNKPCICIFILLILTACRQQPETALLIIPVDTKQDHPIALSVIADNVEAVELELTDNSMIGNWYMGERVVCTSNHILFLDMHKNQLLLFNRKGKFLRQIGKQGQGPGEYTRITDIAADEKENRIYISCYHKGLIYDFKGNYLKPFSIPGEGAEYLLSKPDGLIAINTRVGTEREADGAFHNTCILYKLNKDLQITDSLKILSVAFEKSIWIGSPYPDFISVAGKDTFVNRPVYIPEPVTRDTLFQMKGHQLLPNARLAFSGEAFAPNGWKNIIIHHIYRSSRYIFSRCHAKEDTQTSYFCYDTQTGQSNNAKNGYIDDFHTQEKVRIRSFKENAEMFYYIHPAQTDDDNGDEPNPMLYIGTLKK